MKKKAKKSTSRPRNRARPVPPVVPEPAKKRDHKFFVFCANSGELEQGHHTTYLAAMTAAVGCLQSRANHRYLILEEVNSVYAHAVSVSEDKV